MSTGLECVFVEKEKDKWYYILENWDAPKNAWSWLDYATAYGPFSSFVAAKKDLESNHSNPGGYDVVKAEHYNALSADRRTPYEDLFSHAIKI